jgi:hypothetical protein
VTLRDREPSWFIADILDEAVYAGGVATKPRQLEPQRALQDRRYALTDALREEYRAIIRCRPDIAGDAPRSKRRGLPQMGRRHRHRHGR